MNLGLEGLVEPKEKLLSEEAANIAVLTRINEMNDKFIDACNTIETIDQLEDITAIVSEEGFNDTMDKLYGQELRDAGIDTTADTADLVEQLEGIITTISTEATDDPAVNNLLNSWFMQYLDTCKMVIKQINAGSTITFPTKERKLLPAATVKEQLGMALDMFDKLSNVILEGEEDVKELAKKAKEFRKEYMKRGFWGPKLRTKAVKQTYEEAGWTAATLKELCEWYVEKVTSFDMYEEIANKTGRKAASASDEGKWGKVKLFFSTNASAKWIAEMIMFLFGEVIVTAEAARIKVK